MKSKKLILSLLVLLGATWAQAEEVSVKVAGDRSAVIQVQDKAGEPEVSGTIKGAANLKEGKSGIKADLVLKNAAELQGAQGDFYAITTGNAVEMIGFINAKLPPDPNAPTVLDVDLETVTEGDQSAAKFNAHVEGPAKGPTPKGSGKVSFKGDFKKLSTNGDFELSGGDIKSSEIPFNKFELNITEKDKKTTISFLMAAPKTSEMAKNLESLPALKPLLEGKFKEMGVTVEGVDFPKPTEEGENKIGKGQFTIVDIRAVIKPYLGIVAAQMPGVPEGQTALEEMLEAQMDKLSLVLEVQEAGFKGNFAMDGSNLDRFWSGYLTLLPAMQEMSNQQMLADAGEFRVILEPLLKLNTKQTVDSLKILASSSISIEGEGKFNLDVTGEAAAQVLAFKADGNLLMSNYADYATKAKAAGLPVPEKAVGKLKLNLKDKTALTGDAYFYTDGNMMDFYKNMLGQAAKDAQASEEVQKAIADFKFEDAGFKATLKDNKVSLLGRSTTSDLTGIASLLFKKGLPQLDGTFSGGAVDITMDDKASGKADVKFFFSNFMPGKDAAAIKEALGLPSSAVVTMDAPADQVALVAVEQPELAVDGQLVAVQEAGKSLLASSPADVATTGPGGTGGNKWGLIAVGVLLLLGVGGFLAFGNKSA